jgi:type IV pilus assembly protein PilE
MAMQWTTGRADTRGFTLVELMVVIVIVSILMAIAIPSYKNSIRKSRRTDAKTALLDLAGREERFFSTNGAYTNVAANLGYPGWGAGFAFGGGYYTMAQPVFGAGTAATVATFALQADPVAGSDQAKDTACASFRLNSTGVQSASGTATTDCW